MTLAEINALDSSSFVEQVGPVFEHSPWIAERTWKRRPFDSVASLHSALVVTVEAAAPAEKLALIRAHPDLVGRAARAGTLTTESTNEQSAAGLSDLSAEEIELFDRYNGAYKDRFGFPFVICARENKKASILAAFPLRLENEPEREVQTALAEIAKIAGFRLQDLID
jgi:2-oxo-4-hydroxy-4-carboxy-5-ureidoimidazoline decarboxylase